DVEGEDPEGGNEVARGEPRVAVDPAHAGPALPRAVGDEAPANPVVDQVAIREPDVGLEALHPGGVKPGPERRHVSGPVDLDPPHRLARERDEPGRRDTRRRLAPRELVGRDAGDEEVGREPIVDDEGGLTALENGVEVNLGSPGDEPVRRGEDEAALAQRLPSRGVTRTPPGRRGSVRRSPSGAAPTGSPRGGPACP